MLKQLTPIQQVYEALNNNTPLLIGVWLIDNKERLLKEEEEMKDKEYKAGYIDANSDNG
jgi:hypothetical protein